MSFDELNKKNSVYDFCMFTGVQKYGTYAKKMIPVAKKMTPVAKKCHPLQKKMTPPQKK